VRAGWITLACCVFAYSCLSIPFSLLRFREVSAWFLFLSSVLIRSPSPYMITSCLCPSSHVLTFSVSPYSHAGACVVSASLHDGAFVHAFARWTCVHVLRLSIRLHLMNSPRVSLNAQTPFPSHFLRLRHLNSVHFSSSMCVRHPASTEGGNRHGARAKTCNLASLQPN